MEIKEGFKIETNEYQTPVDKELLDSLPDEVGEQLLDFIDNVEYIKRLISPNRKRAKDLPKDDQGRIFVDLTNPHILENMDYFRPSALFYQQNKCYTFLRPNPNPNSEYKKWFDEEKRRCREGYVRESDGEWVTGYMYWYMNYCPIMLNKTMKGSKKAMRIEDFPETWEGIYLRFHYIEQARNAGKHAIELARRGCSKSYSLASMMAKNLILGENSTMTKRVTTILTAYQKEYLADKDGTLSKFEPMINFIAENTEFPRLRLRSSSQEMFWQMGYTDSSGRKKGNLNTVMGVSSKDDEAKLRGKRGHIYFEEMGCFLAGTKVLMYPTGVKNIEDIRDGDLVMGKDNTPRTVSNFHSGRDMMYKITLSNGDTHVVNSRHLIHYKKLRWDKREYEYYNKEVKDFITIPNTNKGYYIEKVPVSYEHKDCLINPYTLGLWLGDGDSRSTAIANEDTEVIHWLQKNYDTTIVDLKQSNACKVIYLKNVRRLFISLNLLNNKHIPDVYLYNTADVYKQVLAGLIDSDGNLSVKAHSQCFEITQRHDRLHILEGVKFMATNLGLRCTLTTRKSVGKKPGVVHYRLRISGDISIIPTKIKRKQALPKEIHYKERRNWTDYTFKVEPLQEDTFYGFEVDKDNLFLLADNTVVHNSFKNLLSVYDTVRYGLEEGNYTFGLAYLVGTAAEDASDFESAKTLLYSPEGYNIYGIQNIYDKPKQGKATFGYFFPAFLNRLGCYNKDGVSDVIKALVEILMNRYKAKYSTDPNSVLRVIAEMPITPAEAILKVKAAYFPTVALTERLGQLDADPRAFDDVYVGALTLDKDGSVKFKPNDDTPIRKFGGVDNSTRGALEIFEMPEKNKDGNVYNDRYIIGHDPVDNDQADSSSLSSTIVLDLFTDKIVAEYTGRQPFADDNYEILRLLCLFYNARCLYEAHPYNQKVITPDGIKKWGDIKIGDYLFDPDGHKTKVIDIPIDGEDDIYRITLKDGRSVEASKNHIWHISTIENRYNLQDITTVEMFNSGTTNKYGQHKYFIPKQKSVEFPHKEVPIDPYTLGLLIAEGALTKFPKEKKQHNIRRMIQFSSCKEDAEFYKTVIPYNIKYIGNKGYSWHMYIDNIDIKLKSLGLLHCNSHNKFIPDLYMYNDKHTRIELLKGLMDGDGCAVKSGASVFITTSKHLSEDVKLLCHSLGITAYNNKGGDNYYRVAISSQLPLFKLPRKINNQHKYTPKAKGSKAASFLTKTAIESIEYIGRKKCKCVTVENPNGLYLIGDYVVTHNCNKKGVFAYFSRMSCTHLLADTPEFLRDKQLIKYSNFGSNAKGVNASAAINDYANRLIRDWLLKPVTTTVKEGDEEKQIQVPNLYFLRNRALIQELIAFTPEINVDRVRALGMAMLLREEKIILYQGDLKRDRDTIESSYLGNDDFFTRNYDNKFNSYQ